MPSKSLTATEANSRHIRASDFAPCDEAFIDRRNPNSGGKQNYSFIGPGVTQSATQVVNLQESHGFNVGGVTLPPGRLNNLHLHYTAEVFIPVYGDWEFLWGNHAEGHITCGPRDIFTIPTWIFRGFINRGGDDAFMFAVIGKDQPGGIVWHPQVLNDATAAGMRLTADDVAIDVQRGDDVPAGTEWKKPINQQQLDKLPTFSVPQVEDNIIRWNELDWRTDALPGGGELATVLGHGMTAARHHYPPVAHSHSFALEWLRLQPGEHTGHWSVDMPQVLFAYTDNLDIELNADGEVTETLGMRSLFSVPAGVPRALVNTGDATAVVLVATGGDERVLPQWDDATLAAELAAGNLLDPDGFLSPHAALHPHHA